MFKEGKKIWSFILDCVFPQACLGCGADDQFLCANCQALIVSPGVFEKPDGPITELSALAEYHPGSVSGKLIEALKYDFSPEAAQEISQWVKNSLQIFSQIKVDLIIPIPLHPRRAAERGFNQAEIIAKPIAKILAKPIATSVLVRIKQTKQQALLNKVERSKNLEQAFKVQKLNQIKGKTCLLVDDVYTTGSTMQAAATALLAGGATKVVGFTLARAAQ